MNELLLVKPDGTYRLVDNNYASIKQAMDGATLDVVYLGDTSGDAFFVDDEAMLHERVFNTIASMMTGIVIYGSVVLIGPASSDGETTPPSPRTLSAARNMAKIWHSVYEDAEAKGQNIFVTADSSNIPGPVVIGLNDDEFAAWLRGER